MPPISPGPSGPARADDGLVEDGRPEGWLDEESQRALARAPYAAKWARRFAGDEPVSLRRFRRHAAPSIVRDAVVGISQADVPDPDLILHDLLVGAIEDCRKWVPTRPERPEPASAPHDRPLHQHGA